jgi:hypothetical protein
MDGHDRNGIERFRPLTVFLVPYLCFFLLDWRSLGFSVNLSQ